MVVAMTGGGSGGHITPLLAVAHELKALKPDLEVVYIGQTGDNLNDIPSQDRNIDRVELVRAGKFRRYHGESWLQHVLDLPTLFKNIRDGFYVLIGVWQSFRLLRRMRPSVIFVKGGFVGVPVGLSAALLKIPYVTHDSDSMPGLANRIIARWARLHAVALPKEVYSYPQDKTVTVGVPISHLYRPLSKKQQQALRNHLGLEGYDKVLLITGGGLGAKILNEALVSCAGELLARYPDLAVVLIAGRGKDAATRKALKKELSVSNQKRVIVKDYVTNLYQYSGAADAVVTRAGGTAMAELAAQAKATVVVPSPFLAGGHQLKNARVLAARKAVRLVHEDVLKHDHRALMPPITELLDKPSVASKLGDKLAGLSRPDSAHDLAVLLLDCAKKS